VSELLLSSAARAARRLAAPALPWQGDRLTGSTGRLTLGGTVREVEVKYQVRDNEALLVALKRRGIEFAPAVYQDDQAYAPHGWSYGEPSSGCPLRACAP